MRRDGEEYLSFRQRLAHEAECIMLEITQPAVNKFGRGGRSTLREIAHFGESDFQSTPCSIARDAAAVDTAADNQKIVGLVLHASSLGPPAIRAKRRVYS